MLDQSVNIALCLTRAGDCSMTLPTYDELMLPLLKLTAQTDQEHPIRELREQLAQQLNLTPEQRTVKLPSSRQAVFDNRVGWASTYLRKAKLLERTRRGYVRITKRGRKILGENPSAINDHYLQRFNEFKDFKERATSEEQEGLEFALPSKTNQPITPDEVIRNAYSILEANLRDDLLDKIKQMDPSSFEWLVLRLLHAMGYGGSIKDVEGVPTGPDGGIDGLIKEDKLGLEAIYIQAKRWENDKSLGSAKFSRQSEFTQKRTFLRHISPECSTLADIVSISQVHYGVMPALGANPLCVAPSF